MRKISKKVLMIGVALPAIAIMSEPVFAQDAQVSQPQSETDEPDATAESPNIIVVEGVRASLVQAQEVKRDADNIVDVVTMEDVGKYTDENLAETLQRVPGVQISRTSTGEGEFVSVRGLGPGFTRSSINGRTAFGGSGGDAGLNNRRALSLTDFPPELAGGIRVAKSPTADLDEGGIGGNIDIQTLRPLNIRNRLFNDDVFVTASADYSFFEQSDSWDPRLSGVAAWKITDEFAVLAAGSYRKRKLFTEVTRGLNGSADNDLYTVGDPNNPADNRLCLNASCNNQEILVENLLRPGGSSEVGSDFGEIESHALSFSAQYRPSPDFELTLDYSRTRSDRTGQRSAMRFLAIGNGSTLRNIEYVPTDYPNVGGVVTSAEVREGINGLGRFNGRSLTNADSSQNFSRREDFYGAHATINPAGGPLTIDIDISRLDSEFDRDNFIVGYVHTTVPEGWYFDTTRLDGALILDILPGADGSTYDPLTDIEPLLTQIGYNAINLGGREDALQVDFDYETNWDIGFFSFDSFEAGGKYRNRFNDQIFNVIRFNTPQLNALYAETGTTAPSPLDFPLSYDYPEGAFLADANLSYADWFHVDVDQVFDYFDPLIFGSSQAPGGVREREPVIAPNANFFEGEEEIFSAYLMTNFSGQIGAIPFRGNIGMRYADTSTIGRGVTVSAQFTPDGETILDDNGQVLTADPVIETDRGGYDDWLPSGNLALELTPNLQLRFAASKVISRPEVSDIAGPSEIRQGAPTDEGGTVNGVNITFKDPNLEPFRATQWETILEWYPGNQGAFFALGYFDKDIKNFNAPSRRVLNPGESITLRGTTFTARADNPDTEEADGFRVQLNSTQSAEGTRIRGLEFQSHIPFDWIIGDNSFLSDFGFRGTFTRLFTNNSPLTDVITGDFLPLIGASKTNYSLVGYYDNGPLEIRGSYTYRSSNLSDPSSFFGGSLFDDETKALDANISYDFTPNLGVRFQARNLLAEPVKQFFADGLFPYTYTRTGRQYVVGVRAQF